MKKLKASVLAVALCAGASQALPLLDVDFGMTLGTDINTAKHFKFDSNTNFTIGGYARGWFKVSKMRLAPFIKYENTAGLTINNAFQSIVTGESKRDNNLQYGLLLGVNLAIFTPYVGMAYSQFINSNLSDTWALNYGLAIKIPVVPLSVGLDASWQRPFLHGVELNVHRIAVTFGVRF